MLLPSGRTDSNVENHFELFLKRKTLPQLQLCTHIENCYENPHQQQQQHHQQQQQRRNLEQKNTLATAKEATEQIKRKNLSTNGNQQNSETGNVCATAFVVVDHNRRHVDVKERANIECMSTSTSISDSDSVSTTTTTSVAKMIENWTQSDKDLQEIQRTLKYGWSVHANKDGRLYYCNHLTQNSTWIPSHEDWSKSEDLLPYGWERAIDSKGRPYYLNHVNKTSTYEAPEAVTWDGKPPEPRIVVLQRSATMGFGFVAGSERPVIVRFVTEDGPSTDKLLPGDQILAVQGEDVKESPRDHVIQLVRACESQVTLLVCQPAHNLNPGRKSTLLSAGKRAKLRTRPSRVRFAESVCVNGAPLFPPSAFSLGDICVPPMANVLKVFLENGQTKSFKYDATTTVQDVVTSLLDKLCLTTGQIFSLVLEHVKSVKRNKLTLLDPDESLARIAARPGAHKLRCLFRVSFVPTSAADLAQKDLNALDYLYMQCCNDVTQERFSPELQPEVALRLAALHMHQHALANNVSPMKLTVKVVEQEFGLERFVPITLFDGMKRKELRRLISHFLKLNAEMTGSSGKILTQLQAKLHYLDIIAGLPSYGAKCFSTTQKDGIERVLLVSPRFGLSQISSARNSVPQPISAIRDFKSITVNREDDVTSTVNINMQSDRNVKFTMEDRDACEFSLVLAGYYRLLTGNELDVKRQRDEIIEDLAPSYLTQHTVLPANWSYLPLFRNKPHSINFLQPPPFHATDLELHNPNCDQKSSSNNLVNNMCNKQMQIPLIGTMSMDVDIHSVVATELLEEAKDSSFNGSNHGIEHNYSSRQNTLAHARNEEVMRRVHEMQVLVESSEQYLTEQGEQMNTENVQRTPNNQHYGLSSNVMSQTIEFDSDCDSINSSKISSSEDTSHQNELRHSDSLVLLAEVINQDLNGITKGLNSISSSQHESTPHSLTLSATSSPLPERKLNGLSQLLSNLQALGNDFSQSESDSESVNSPPNSPIVRRPCLFPGGIAQSNRNNASYRSSFGLHSPDGNQFTSDTKDYNLKEYLKQLKEISNAEICFQDTDMAAQKLSEIYGFKIEADTFIKTDTDLIDLRSIPPPQTPDELDALSLLNAPPKGFDDTNTTSETSTTTTTAINTTTTSTTPSSKAHTSDLDQFLAKVVVAPPTQKATPAKELTPEEIMSFIIPPPPCLNMNEQTSIENKSNSRVEDVTENLYSNAITEKREFYNKHCQKFEAQNKPATGRVIEYSTVERKGKFSCCPKSKKETLEATQTETLNVIQLPPRSPTLNRTPPARPPKSSELLERLSPKNQFSSNRSPDNSATSEKFCTTTFGVHAPPQLPPRLSTAAGIGDRQCKTPTLVSVAPKKPPLPPVANRPLLRSNPNTTESKTIFNHKKLPYTLPATAPLQSPTPIATPSPTSTPTPLNELSMHVSQVMQQDTPVRNHRPNNEYPHHPHHHHHHNHNHTVSVGLESPLVDKKSQFIHIYSPKMPRKISSPIIVPANKSNLHESEKLIIKNGHVIDGEALLAKTDVAMAGLLIKLDQVAAQCSASQAAGGGINIDEVKFQRARHELTEQTVVLVTASKYLVMAMSDVSLTNLPEHLTSCLTAIRRITELTQDMTRHTSAPLQTRNIVLKVHDVASSFRELVSVQIGAIGAGQLALQAECLANVLATLLRSLRVFSP